MDIRIRLDELIIANRDLATELILADKELAFQNDEKAMRAAELIIANKELVFENAEKAKRAAELVIANRELVFQNDEKEKRAAELIVANKELVFQNEEKEKRAAELVIANKELVFQNEEKEKRAAELVIANKELVFQNEEKEKRAAELIIANKELIFENVEKAKRAAELVIANKELVFQNEEKEKRAAELIIANKELAFQNEEKEIRSEELLIANRDLKSMGEKYLKMVAEVQDYSIILLNKDGIIQNWNKGAEKMKLYKEAEIVGKHFSVFYMKVDQENKLPEKLIQEAMEKGKAIQEGWRVRKDGTQFWANVVITALHDQHSIIGFSKVIRDLTKAKLAEEVVTERTKALEFKNAELAQFAYVASHDLQEPLRTVSNYIQVLEEDHSDQLDANAKKHLSTIGLAIKRMSTLVKAFLNFSQLGRNKTLVNADCNKVVNDVIMDLENLITTSGTTIKVGELPWLNVYEIELRQLFQNLIVNAIKFKKKNVPCEIQVGCKHSVGKWQFHVSDNGIGIDPKFSEHIFYIFQRVHTTGEYEGYGIGLANCKKIVEQHGGDIWIESTPGLGSTFYFTILNLSI
ncbi:MAG: ATP-binding protein [Ferruginibacter sp.]